MPLPLNQQPPEKQHLDEDGKLVIHSIFYTIQGEGPFAGVPAVFVRLAGCNLQCPRCDTDYRPIVRMTVAEVSRFVNHLWKTQCPAFDRGMPLVVLTGGEPFRQNIRPVLEELLSDGYVVQIETNGTLYVDLAETWDAEYLHVVCSPKTGSVNPQLQPHINAYKYVLHADEVDPTDGLPIRALEHGAHPRVARPPALDMIEIYVQPIDVQNPVENARHLKAAAATCMRYGYTLCVQMHKLATLE